MLVGRVGGKMSNYTIAVLVGWVIAVWALCSVLFSAPAKFSNLGRSKGRWFLIELTALIPYVGFIAVLFYIFMVRVHFPPRPKRAWTPSPAPTRPAGGGGGGGGSGSWPPPTRTPPPKVKCTCQNGTVPCGCGNGYVGRTERHYPCGGTGRLRCQMCGGSGYR